jgi:predicted RNA-binding protein with PUA-like domain
MARWLLKTEPDCYSWEQLVKDKKTTWDGVSNALALKHLRTMKKGDEALIYHTGDEKAVVGMAEVVSAPYADPKEGDERLAVVDLRPKKKLKNPVTLSDVKADPAFSGWDLIRNSRLSVMPVPDSMWARIEELAEAGDVQTSRAGGKAARRES